MAEDQCDIRIIHHEKVEKARASLLTADQLDDLSAFFKVFADQNRLRIVMALQEQEMCVCDIAAFLNISESAVSHQLRFLRTSGLVKNRREGTVLYYRLVDDHVSHLIRIGLEHVQEIR